MQESEFFKEIGTPMVFLQYKGIWDMDDVYQTIADFLRENKFKLNERMQRHRVPSPFGVERQYLFEGVRKVENYYKWTVTINIETFDEHDVEVVTKDGTKKKMAKGRMWMRISAVVETDYDKIFESKAFYAHLRAFYNKYVIKKKFEGVWWDQLYYNVVLRLHAKLKERLKMVSEGSEHRYFSGVRS